MRALLPLQTYPLDLAAARLAADQSAKGAARLYRGITDCLHITYRREGILGPWRGLLPSLLVVAPFYGTQIGTYYTLRCERVVADRCLLPRLAWFSHVAARRQRTGWVTGWP